MVASGCYRPRAGDHGGRDFSGSLRHKHVLSARLWAAAWLLFGTRNFTAQTVGDEVRLVQLCSAAG